MDIYLYVLYSLSTDVCVRTVGSALPHESEISAVVCLFPLSLWTAEPAIFRQPRPPDGVLDGNAHSSTHVSRTRRRPARELTTAKPVTLVRFVFFTASKSFLTYRNAGHVLLRAHGGGKHAEKRPPA